MGLFGKKKQQEETPYHPRPAQRLTQPLTPDGFIEAFGGSSDVVRRELFVGSKGLSRATMFFVDGTVSGVWVSEEIIKPLTEHPLLTECHSAAQLFERLSAGGVYNAVCKVRETMDEVAADAVSGSAVLFLPGIPKALSFEAKGYPIRGISEPTDENVIKGAKDAFIENVRSNTAIVRHKLKTPDLRIVETVVGRQSMTTASMVYVEGLTNPELVAELRHRLDDTDIDAVLMAGDLEENLMDQKSTLFPLALSTERSDRFCNGIMAGQIGLLIDGLPFGYLMPMTFAQLMKAPEDFAHSSFAASFVTFLRYISFFVTLLLPAFYLAIVMYHKEMLPTTLAEAIIRTKESVPFSSLTEMTGMLLAFEILLEAGLRLPKAIGQAVSIVGALVIGQAAVEANLISPVIVIVVALAGICGFTTPSQDFAVSIRIWRLMLVVAASLCGIVGVSIFLIAFFYRLATLESFGVPYLAPFAFEGIAETFKRSIFRLPITSVKERPGMLDPQNKRNQK